MNTDTNTNIKKQYIVEVREYPKKKGGAYFQKKTDFKTLDEADTFYKEQKLNIKLWVVMYKVCFDDKCDKRISNDYKYCFHCYNNNKVPSSKLKMDYEYVESE